MTAPLPTPPVFAAFNLGVQELTALVSFGGFFIALVLLVAIQARKRGYSLLVWLLAGLAGNTILLLVMLGVLPDFARKGLRKTEMEDLESRLNRKKVGKPAEAPAQAADVQRSLGDQVTALPERSLGDVETRL